MKIMKKKLIYSKCLKYFYETIPNILIFNGKKYTKKTNDYELLRKGIVMGAMKFAKYLEIIVGTEPLRMLPAA